jgi:hypothetical protein
MNQIKLIKIFKTKELLKTHFIKVSQKEPKVSKNRMGFMGLLLLVRWSQSLSLRLRISKIVNNLEYQVPKEQTNWKVEHLQGLVKLQSTTFLLNKRTL